MAHTFLITEGNIFTHEGNRFVLKSRGLTQASVEGDNGELVTLTKEDCPELFKEILVG
jgi:hypothetical protein